MRFTRVIIAFLFSICLVSNGQSQSPVFEGKVSAVFINPTSGVVEGLGTNRIQFPDSITPGTITFTPVTHYAALDQPFLLGKVDFLAGGTPPEQITFRATLATTGSDGTKGTVSFCPPVIFTEFNEPGFTSQIANFAPTQAWTTRVNGTNYTLAFAGITSDTTWNENGDTILPASLNQEAATGYIWATLKTGGDVQANGGGNGCNDCGCESPPGVPEPSTCVLIAMGMIATVAIRKFNRKSNLSGGAQALQE